MKNMSRIDAIVRGTLGVGLLVTAAAVNDRPFLAIAAALVALLFLGTALTRFCPLYTLLGVGTNSGHAKPHGV